MSGRHLVFPSNKSINNTSIYSSGYWLTVHCAVCGGELLLTYKSLKCDHPSCMGAFIQMSGPFPEDLGATSSIYIGQLPRTGLADKQILGIISRWTGVSLDTLSIEISN